MDDKFNLYDVYEQNLNFLLGAGASFGFLPTLELKIKDANGQSYTLESLAHDLEEKGEENLKTLLFMYYYRECIKPGLPNSSPAPFPPHRQGVLDQYQSFLSTVVKVLNRQATNKKANIYTTNYDSCLELSCDALLSDKSLKFVANDGSDGFQKKRFHTKNYNNRIIQKGIFDKHEECLPQVNLLHLHGSVYWNKEEAEINLNYHQSLYEFTFSVAQNSLIDSLMGIITNVESTYENLYPLKAFGNWAGLTGEDFWSVYKTIPIVNPTKWKFHETVFEEAYYQILRHLSFELERPNSILVTFGFSFADEHILRLVERSLSNPTLTVYICCFNENVKNEMQEKFKGYRNVKFITSNNELTFSEFNKTICSLEKDDA
jgi:hypothetical protein